jgi:hypothetical protein
MITQKTLMTIEKQNIYKWGCSISNQPDQPAAGQLASKPAGWLAGWLQ